MVVFVCVCLCVGNKPEKKQIDDLFHQKPSQMAHMSRKKREKERRESQRRREGEKSKGDI